MSTLVLKLPLHSSGTAAPEYDYVLSPDGLQLAAHGRAPASLLPAQTQRGAHVVAVIPARALSWHCITLPERVLRSLLAGRMEPARARGVLTGVLEEQLLDDAEHLHFAVFAAPAEGTDAPKAWVTVCDRTWLQAGLQALEASGHSVGRIVAEVTPTQAGTARLLLSDEMQPAQMLLCTPQGVSLLPLLPNTLALAQAQTGLDVLAEPAVVAIAEMHFGNQAAVQTSAQRLLQAAQSPWNLAQLELSASPGGRLLKRLSEGWQHMRHSPQWRPARWSLVALVVVQLVALNTLAWQQRALLDEKRNSIQSLLQQTFPEVLLVIDAPLQMQRAVDDLARARGVGSDAELGHVLSIISPNAPAGMALTAIELSGKQLRLSATGLEPAAALKLTGAMEERGLHAQLQGGQLLIEAKESR